MLNNKSNNFFVQRNVKRGEKSVYIDMYMRQIVLQIISNKITDIKTFHNTSPSTHLRQYTYGDLLLKNTLTPY